MKIISNKHHKTVAILEDKDLREEYCAICDLCSWSLDYAFIPLKLKSKFLLSDLRKSILVQMRTGGKIYYYEESMFNNEEKE